MNTRLSRRQWLLGSLASTLAGCLPDDAFKHRYTTVPEPLADGWKIATPEDVGLDRAALETIHDELLLEDRHRGALGLLVVKDGKLVWETYLHDPRDRDRHHHVQSVTKSVTSLAFGIARDRGFFGSLNQTLGELIPDKLSGRARDKAAITIEQLLTMRSGIRFDNENFAIEMWVDRPSDPLHYMLQKPFYDGPGASFYYRDVDPQVLGYLLQRATHVSEEAWTRKWLFSRLGIEHYLWEHGPDGVSMAAHGLHLKPRDLLKIGQLMLDGGTFEGQRLVSQDWIARSTRTQVAAGGAGTRHEQLGYGYYWWTVRGSQVFSAWGHGGQHVLVAPADRLVIVKIALPDTDDLHGSSLEEFLDLVGPLLQ